MGILFVCRNTMDHSEIRFLLGLPAWPQSWKIIVTVFIMNESMELELTLKTRALRLEREEKGESITFLFVTNVITMDSHLPTSPTHPPVYDPALEQELLTLQDERRRWIWWRRCEADKAVVSGGDARPMILV